MRRSDYMASIVRQLGKLSTDALKYLDQWSFPLGVIPILKAYDDGELLRRIDCDMEVALAMEEIVRCGDCRHYDPNGEPSEVYPDRHWCDKLTVYMPPLGFCSFGKGKR